MEQVCEGGGARLIVLFGDVVVTCNTRIGVACSVFRTLAICSLLTSAALSRSYSPNPRRTPDVHGTYSADTRAHPGRTVHQEPRASGADTEHLKYLCFLRTSCRCSRGRVKTLAACERSLIIGPYHLPNTCHKRGTLCFDVLVACSLWSRACVET